MINLSKTLVTLGLVTSFVSAALLTPLAALAGSKQTQQEATAASLATGALLYNYGRHQNSRNGAYALAAGAGTAYLWNKYSQQRHAENRQQAARTNYYRRRAGYYHRLATTQHRKTTYYHRTTRKVYRHR